MISKILNSSTKKLLNYPSTCSKLEKKFFLIQMFKQKHDVTMENFTRLK